MRVRRCRPPDSYFYGNLDVGDSLLVRLCAERSDERGVARWCELVRGCDQGRIADIVMLKQWGDGPAPTRSRSTESVASCAVA